jgi:dTDP-4-dehydrorhamnose reductase
MQKTILVTGANGQLGKSLQQIAPDFSGQFRFLFTDVDTLDITDLAAVRRMAQAENVDFLINAAAYTAVDKAESDIEFAYLLNEKAVANLATAAKETGAFLIHVSTDYVFDGQASVPYRTNDPTNPTSVYGKSKLAGETAIVQSGCRGAIVRTAWLYSPYGNNFVKTMLRLADTKEFINVVSDQTGCPTLALDLARFLMAVIAHDGATEGVKRYHFTNKGRITWFDFASEIIRQAGKTCPVHPIPTSSYPTPATRPAFSVLDLSESEAFFDIPDWKESLTKVLPEIIYNYEHNIF